MQMLALSTAEKECVLAWVADGVPVCEASWSSRQTHSRRLMEMVDHILRKWMSADINSIDAFVVAKGPGSFTGLRIGISVVKALSWAVSKPAAGVSSLDGIARRFSVSDLPVCALMDARRSEVYAAFYRFRDGNLVEKSAETAESPSILVENVKEKTLFAGSGALAYRDLIRERLGGLARFAPGFQNSISPAALAEAVLQNPGLLKDSREIVPEYIRRSDAEMNFRPVS